LSVRVKSALRIALVIIGGLGVIFGVLFIGQGTGLFPYPRQSFMVNQMPWAYRGIGLAVTGLFIILISRRFRRD
jgi:hypothetical protein